MRQFATIAARAAAALTVLAWAMSPAGHGAWLQALQALRAAEAGQQPGQIQQPKGTWQKPGECSWPASRDQIGGRGD